MKSKAFEWTARIVALAVMAGVIGAAAQNYGAPKTFRGVLNGYTPQVTTGSPTSGTPLTTTGPYEVRGPWSLKLKRDGLKADFSAAVNMEFSDGWVVTAGKFNFDPNARGAHTHHITLTGGDVTPLANGFQVTGTANFTLNGGPAPVTVAPSPVVILITGGTDVEYSNISLTFLPPGSNHFGPAPIPGVVRSVTEDR